MKLKKFAAMMLAGVMAVSMLAGCSGKGTNGGNGNGEVVIPGSSSSAVNVFNANQAATNKVKVEFSSDASLDAALADAVKAIGSDPKWSDAQHANMAPACVAGLIYATTGVGGDDLMDKDTAADGETATVLRVARFSNVDVYSEVAALRQAVNGLNDFINDELIDTTFVKGSQAAGSKYFDFSYTGNVSVASAEKPDGSKVYFVAYTVTQTAAEQTYTK